MVKKKKLNISIIGASYCGAGIYKVKFSDGKVIQFNCHEDDYKKDFFTPRKNTFIMWLENFGGPLELDKEPKADFKFSDERNFSPGK
jgi:hypothetical protein